MSSRTSLQNSPTDFNDSLLKKSMKTEKIFTNNDKLEISTEKRDIVSTSSYKFLSWREKDRRRRFRDEWKHMWLVIPHGNFEVMCLVCHKVMTQRKLDTIKRHTVRRHTEILDMNQGERTVLFEKLFLEHNSLKIQQKNNNNNCLSDTVIENGKAESEVIDLEKMLSSDCVSATSSSSLSPSDSRENNSELNFFTKRGKYPRKNIKINVKSMEKTESVKSFSRKTTVENQSSCNRGAYKSNIKAPLDLDTKSYSAWSNAACADRLLPGNIKTLQDSFFSKFNGSSCLNFLPPMPVISKCPMCLEDCSPNGTETNNAFARLMSHIQQKHPDKFPTSIPSFDLNQSSGTNVNDLVKLQSLLMPPTTNNSNFTSVSNSFSNANLISLLYYQELLRQNVPTNHISPQFSSVSSDPLYYQATPPLSSNSSMFPLFSSPSPQCSIRPSSSLSSGFILPTISDQLRFEQRSDQIQNNLDNATIFEKFLPFKRAKFSAESLISEANKQSAFYNPKTDRSDEKDINFNSVTNMPLGSNTYATANELVNSRCKETGLLGEELFVNNDTKPDPIISNPLSQSESVVEKSLSPKSSAQGNLICHAMRFGPGQDLKAGLLEYIRRRKISAAFIMTCCGSLTHAKLRMADSGILNSTLEIRDLKKHFEIVSLVGSISDHDCHLHISLSDCNGDVIGGHVVGNLIVHTTAEVMLGQICGVEMHRELDDSTGYEELSFTSPNSI